MQKFFSCADRSNCNLNEQPTTVSVLMMFFWRTAFAEKSFANTCKYLFHIKWYAVDQWF
jgi:hypothetical protein